MPLFPQTLRVEAKFTTASSVALPKREREALMGHDKGVVGVVAALFWYGNRDLDGRWFVVDIDSVFLLSSVRVADLRRLEKRQENLSGIRDHLSHSWVPFLSAFRESALRGHSALQEELKDLHDGGKLAERLIVSDVLDYEHRSAVQAIVDHHGALVAGHIFQDLLAYVLSLAGYRTIRTNPVGVPDIELTDLVAS